MQDANAKPETTPAEEAFYKATEAASSLGAYIGAPKVDLRGINLCLDGTFYLEELKVIVAALDKFASEAT